MRGMYYLYSIRVYGYMDICIYFLVVFLGVRFNFRVRTVFSVGFLSF